MWLLRANLVLQMTRASSQRPTVEQAQTALHPLLIFPENLPGRGRFMENLQKLQSKHVHIPPTFDWDFLDTGSLPEMMEQYTVHEMPGEDGPIFT